MSEWRDLILDSTLFSTSYERRIAVSVCVAFSVFAAAAAVFGQSIGPDTTTFVPVVAITWSLCDLLTAFFLFLLCYGGRRPALAVIGAAYLCTGLLTWPYLMAYFSNTYSTVRDAGNQQVPATLYIIWHLLFAVLILTAQLYERSAKQRARRPQLLRIVLVTAGSAVAAALGIGVWVHLRRAELPEFIIHGIFQPVYWGVAIPIVILTTAIACVVLIRQKPGRNSITTWLTVALFTSLLDALLTIASPIRFSYAWDAGKLITASTAFILMAYLLLENARLHIKSTNEIDARTNRGAARLRALWQIATSESTNESAHVQMVLDVATAHIRSGRSVLGVISHREDGNIVIDAQCCQDASTDLAHAATLYLPGQTFPASSDVHGLIESCGQTSYWNDDTSLIHSRCTSAGLRSVIGSPIYVGNRTHFITFSLIDELSDEPFIESDVAFVDVVASNIGHRFHQRTQLERLQYQIEHDSLTSLYNRTQFLRFGRLGAAKGTLFGIVVINLDDFQRINARSGQMVGDELLVEIAATIRLVDEGDIVARLGGDDFAVLLSADEGGRTLEERLALYTQAFQRPFHTGDRDGKIFLNVTASLGAATFVRGRQTFDQALANANVALDAAKASGGGAGVAFGSQLEAIAVERALEGDEIRAALRNQEFVLEYQPTIDMVSGSIVGAEALIRWLHPTRGQLPPSAFLGSVRRANLLAEMTALVLRQIARDLKDPRVPIEIRFYLNVPAHVLESDSFLLQLEELFDTEPTLANRLGIEITESEVMNNIERTISALQGVRKLGLRVAIDDFGTGYSSLSYLKRLPIDVVKLDKSFIDGLPEDENDIELATMFLTLTKQLGFDSVAEGIENKRQAVWLTEHGCMIAQGFYFSKPLPLPDFIAYARMRNPAKTALLV
jgi:diguanylate cyclase (GGDEF)-like protein